MVREAASRTLSRFLTLLFRLQDRVAPPRVRAYRAGDERPILRLFRSTFGKRKSLGRWRWEFLENPFGKPNIVVLESDRAGIVGHYGGIPVTFRVQGERITASQIVDVMIHPAFRGRANLGRLARAYSRCSRENGIQLLYGFNGAAVARSNRRFFGAEIAPVSEWVHDISKSQAPHAADGDLEVSTLDRCDAWADALWERIEGGFPSAVVRDRRYLDWRYSARSDHDYVFGQATEVASGRIVAAIVLGASDTEGLILELLSDPEDEKAIAVLLRMSIDHSARIGKRRVRAWMAGNGKLRQCAQAAGFRALEERLYLNLMRLDDSLDPVVLRETFTYTLGDYDMV